VKLAVCGAILAALLPHASAAAPAAGRIMVVGNVSDAHGKPLAGAQVRIMGTRRASAVTGAAGKFAITVAPGDVASLRRVPAELLIEMSKAGYRVDVAGGESRLKLEIRTYDDFSRTRHVVVRSNDRDLTTQLAQAVRDGVLDDTLRIKFIGVPGHEPPRRDLVMSHFEDLVIGPVPAGASSSSPSAGDSPQSAAVPPLKAQPPRWRIPPPIPASRVLADTARRAARPSPERDSIEAARRLAADSCECRVDGMVEVRGDRPLPAPVPVGLWMDETPGRRDSVVLTLGVPQPFTLLASGCGNHRIQFKTYSSLRFSLVSDMPQIDCLRKGPQSVRIVITPSSRY